MARSLVYACPECGTSSPVVTDQDDAPTLDYATCPECGEKNPRGVQLDAASVSRTRWIGTPVASATAVGIWFFPFLAYLTVALAVAISVLVIVVRARANVLRWYEVLTNASGATLLLAGAWFYPQWVALLPLVLAFRFATYIGNDSSWTSAAEKLRFGEP